MSVNTKRVLYRFFIFALMGLLLEVLSGSWWQVRHGNWNMHGSSSPWMIFDYGLIGVVLMPIAQPMIRRGIPLLLRAVVYMAAIFLVEFVSGWLFDICSLEIWDYSSMPHNLFGYIAVGYIPIWYGLGLFLEFLYKRVDVAALVLAKGLRAPDIEAAGL